MDNKKILKSNVTYEFENLNKLGGQQCGMPISTLIAKSEELGIEIRIKHFRSNHQNKKLASLLMDLTIDELIR